MHLDNMIKVPLVVACELVAETGCQMTEAPGEVVVEEQVTQRPLHAAHPRHHVPRDGDYHCCRQVSCSVFPPRRQVVSCDHPAGSEVWLKNKSVESVGAV